jgi:hypothetical protein
MGRPKGSKNKKTAAASPVRIVDPPEDFDDAQEAENEETAAPPGETAANRVVSPDLDLDRINEGIRARDDKRVGENITDIARVLDDLEKQFSTIKADYTKRIKVVRAVLADNIHELEQLTHTEVFDHDRGQVYLVHNSQVRIAEDLIRTIAETDDEDERADWIKKLDAIAKTTRAVEFEDAQEGLPFAAEG